MTRLACATTFAFIAALISPMAQAESPRIPSDPSAEEPADQATATTTQQPDDNAATAPAATARRLDRLDVVGSKAAAVEMAGSATYLDRSDLDRFASPDIGRTLRQAPGVYAIDEEGYGLRPNIGIRGSGTDRSARITLMEDGVLIAPAPYAAPSAYYFPTAARLNAIELRKGSSAIEAGPRTTGGVLNLISTPIPNQSRGFADLSFGESSDLLGHAWFGTAGDHGGFIIESVRQDVEGFKHTDGSNQNSGYELNDHRIKGRISSAPGAEVYQTLEFKAGATDQDGDETYLGLTEADFAEDPYRRYAGSARDRFQSDHRQLDLRHRIEWPNGFDLTTTAYRHDFQRNWFKLDFVGGVGIAELLANPAAHAAEYAWVTGADSPDNAFRLRNNRRRYDAQGIQSVVGWQVEVGRTSHDVELGVRWHEDEEDRLHDDDRFAMRGGELLLTSDGAPGTQDNREGLAKAVAVHLRDEIRLGSWLITPGVRHESIDLTRLDYARTVDGRDAGPTRTRRNSLQALTPGIGVAWLGNDHLTLFASAHRGFNPPGPGSGADPEWSRNLEAGLRLYSQRLTGELVAFHNQYDNLIGSCTASSGAGCQIGDQFDGGEATVRGLELAAAVDVAELSDAPVGLPARLALTYTDARFDTSFQSDFDEWGDVEAGDRLPYLPEFSAHGSIGIAMERFRADLGATYLDAVRTVAGQGPAAPLDRTDEALVFDLRAGFDLAPGLELYARIENLTDETYVVARRPAGARPGRPRSHFIGLRYRF